MAKQYRRVHCFLCDLRTVWQRIRIAKAARWTVGVHVIYYVHAASEAHGVHFWTAAACAAVLLFEFLSKEK